MCTDVANHTQNVVSHYSKPNLSLCAHMKSIPFLTPCCYPGRHFQSWYTEPHPSRSLNAQIWLEFLAWYKTVTDIKFFRDGWGKIHTGFNFPPLLLHSFDPLLLRLRGAFSQWGFAMCLGSVQYVFSGAQLRASSKCKAMVKLATRCQAHIWFPNWMSHQYKVLLQKLVMLLILD